MVNEGLQEVIHAAARGENVTCILLNNGVFGETGGPHDGHHRARPADQEHPRRPRRRPPRLPDPDRRPAGRARGRRLRGPGRRQHRRATWPGPGACSDGPSSARRPGVGFTFVEILTMCPTGWFIETAEAPDYLPDHLAPVHKHGRAEGRRSAMADGARPVPGLLVGDVFRQSAARAARSGSAATLRRRRRLDLRRARRAGRPPGGRAGRPGRRAGRPGGLVGGHRPRLRGPLLRPGPTGRRLRPAQSAVHGGRGRRHAGRGRPGPGSHRRRPRRASSTVAELLAAPASRRSSSVPVPDEDDPHVIFFTSGTTGRAQGRRALAPSAPAAAGRQRHVARAAPPSACSPSSTWPAGPRPSAGLDLGRGGRLRDGPTPSRSSRRSSGTGPPALYAIPAVWRRILEADRSRRSTPRRSARPTPGPRRSPQSC